MSKQAAYKASGHEYDGRNTGRGGRQNSKITKALKGMASYDLLDWVAKEDTRIRRERERERQPNTSLTSQGGSVVYRKEASQ